MKTAFCAHCKKPFRFFDEQEGEFLPCPFCACLVSFSPVPEPPPLEHDKTARCPLCTAEYAYHHSDGGKASACPVCGQHITLGPKVESDLPPLAATPFAITRDLPLKWLYFTAYVRLPLSMLLAATLIMEGKPSSAFSGLLAAAIQGFLIFGLLQRTLWGWYLAIIAAGLEALGAAAGMAKGARNPDESFALVAGGLIVFGLLWFFPHLVYYRKRRHLFR